MASFVTKRVVCLCVSLTIILPMALSAGAGGAPLTHHGGRLITGNLNVGILWYGAVTGAQRKAILSFLRSLDTSDPVAKPDVASWWRIIESYQSFAKRPTPGAPRITVNVVNQVSDPNYSYGKVLIKDFIKPLLPKATGGKPNTLAIIVAAKGVTVQDMCAGSCAQHGLIGEQAYVAVGDPEEECPECAWPFLPAKGNPAGLMKPPSGNVGADAMVMLLAGGLAGAVTNPYGDGFYATGRGDVQIEATTRCSGIFSTAKLMVDPTTGGVYNTNGDAGTKFLLPALWNPKTSSCWTPLRNFIIERSTNSERVSLVYTSHGGPLYDSTAYTECKEQPEEPLYGGGVFKNVPQSRGVNSYMPVLALYNLTQGTIYSFSICVKVEGSSSAMISATLKTEKETYDCIGTVSAKHGCWSFLKGGFVMDQPSNLSIISLLSADGKDVNIEIASPSLQPFTKQQWRTNQQYIINTQRKRAVTIHVADSKGRRLQGASMRIEQISKDFPFGSAIANTILDNLPYQKWFVKRFNAAVFENELKWNATELDQGKVNYTISDKMLQFVRANKIMARGHNIFWEDPKYNPPWVVNLTGIQLKSAVNSRIQSLMSHYRNEFIHWDINNEMLHFDFYERRLGPQASLHLFETAHKLDPLATLFMNDFNVVETCSDVNSTVDAYISRIRELQQNGVFMNGIGLEGHFTIPNPPLIRAILDKLATLGLPIWLTEVDISKTLDKHTQASYLEQVLREGFSHPSVNGIMLWNALHPEGCYQMCLTDNDLKNLPSGDVVDKLLQQWQTRRVKGITDEHGSYSFYGFLGEYRISVKYGNRTTSSTFSLSRSEETRHFTITL